MSKKNVQEILPLSPVQQGMLFHTLYEPSSTAYIEQYAFPVGDVDPEPFARGVQQLVDRHVVLRTAFVWRNLRNPVQVVHKPGTVTTPIHEEDWSDLPADERSERMASFRRAERVRGFELTKVPAIRVALIRLEPTVWWTVWTYHHLILDGWSVGLMSRELRELIRADVMGEKPKLPKARSFSDFIRWYKRQDLDVAREFWQETLAGFEEPTPLGIDRPVDPASSSTGERFSNIHRRMPLDVGGAAIEFSRGQRVTMPTLVQAAWALVLSRYSGHDDLVFGLTVSGRPYDLPGVQQMLGCFINTLPMRVATPRDTPVRTWLQTVQASLRALRPFEHSPLVEVRGWSGLPADRQLFDSIVVYEGFGGDTAGGGAGGEQLAYRTNYALAIGAMPDAESITFAVGTDRRRISDAAAARLLDHLESAFAWLVTHPETSLGDFVLTDSETEARRDEWRSQATPYEDDQPLTALLDRAADVADADAVAARFVQEDGEEDILTYRELTDASLRLAQHLRSLGVGPEVRVGICVERGLGLLIATLGVMRAGGTYVPLDPDYPTERIHHVLNDAAVAALLTEEALLPKLPPLASDVAVVCLDRDHDTIAAQPATSIDAGADATNLAYVIYTSGSTGKPKGVQIPHRPLVNFLESMAREPGLTGDDRLVAVTTLAFDIAGLELYLPLLVGGQVVIADRETALDGQRLAALLERVGATVMQATPATWRLLLDSGWQGQSDLVVLCGGEALPRELADRLLALDLEVWNLYGPTETTIWSTTTRVEQDPGPVSIGHPIANTQIHIVDHDAHAVATGVVGELLIGGDGLARGYAGRPALTAERFVPDAQTGRSGRRLYRTGDEARWREDGNIDYLGRVDQQVKIRGYRIELGEIESVLADQPGVRHNAVVVRTESAGDHRLIAYWVADAETDAGEQTTTAGLREALAQTLPAYMIPSAFVALDALPLTPNGKVDRGALAKLDVADQDGASTEDGPPLSPLEALVAELWCEVLGRSRVSGRDDFFSLGGHSLLATSLAARLRKVFEVEIPLRALLETPTVRGMAAQVVAAQRAADGQAAPALAAAPEDAEPLLSFAQERMWFLDQLEPGNPFYNIPAAVRLRGTLEPERLADALSEVVARHEVLRTCFRETERQPLVVVLPPTPVELPIEDLASLDETQRETTIRQRVGAEVARPFDLSSGPLLRARLLRCADDEHVLIFTMHHIISDEWSMGVLVREVTLSYGAHVESRPSPLAELPIQYGDFAHWQRGWLRGDALETQLDWWRQQLAGAPPSLALPTDHPRPRTATYRGATDSATLPAAVADPLRALGRKHGATTFMTALASLAVVLGRYAGQDDVVIGTPTANRGHVELEPLIGFFVNTLALRIQFDDDPTFPALLERTRKTALAAHAAQDLPFERLVQDLDPERSLSQTPIFQVMLVTQNANPTAPAPLSGLTIEPLAADTGAAKFDLMVTVADPGQGDLVTQFNYSTDLFDAGTIDQWHRHFHAFLTHAVATPKRPLSAIPLLTEAEQHGCLNPIARRFPSPDLLHDRFARQAAATPDAVAVVCDGAQLDYATLDRAANQVAHHLRRHGVELENLVGLLLERSLDMMVAILGVLKAGGAYLPLDPNLPGDRLSYMIDDAVDATGLSVVLTQDSLAERLVSESPLTVLRIDGDRDAIAAEPDDAPPSNGALHPDQLAYVIYTSGSTGKPKGTAISHRNVIRLFDATTPSYHFGADDVWSMTHSYAFDVSVYEIWGALLYGGKLIVVPYFVTRSPAEMLTLLAEQQITRLSQTPTAFRSLMTAYQDTVENDTVPALESLRSVIFAGEALDVMTVGPWIERFGSADSGATGSGKTGLVPVNMYGITETTVHVAYREIEADDLGHPKVSPIGEPMPDLAMHLLDTTGRPVPVGMAGEIYVAGEGLARGYVARPSLTAQRFVPDPYSDIPGTRLYRSGDLARRRSDGETEFIGRADHQVKIRGFRIELGEIEACLTTHPSITDAVVLAVEAEGDASDRRLVAWVVTAEGEAGQADALRTHLLGQLPDYMVPVAFVPLDALPLTNNGKLDRKALPAPNMEAAPKAAYVAPEGPTETLIATIWCDLLNVERVGANDDFFALGGHSLLATSLAARLRTLLEVEIPLRDLFESPTLTTMARRVETLRQAGQGPLAPPVGLAPEDAPPLLSFAQERMWFLDQLEPGNPFYNIPTAVRLRGELNTEHFAAALSEVVERHHALRTRFRKVDGRPETVLVAAEPVPLPLVDLSDSADDAREAAVLDQVGRETSKPFDLARDPLMRALLVRCADDDHVLVLTMHHIVSDEWSMGVLVREVAASYGARVAGEAPSLPVLPIQYVDFTHWQRGWLQGEVLDGQLTFWREQLAGAPPLLTLPTDRPRPRTPTYRGGTSNAMLPVSVADPLRALGREHGATTFMTALAGLAVVLGRYAGQDDLVIGTPTANRGQVEIESLIGLFVNTLALRVSFDDDPTFLELLEQTRKTSLAAHAAQDLPFEQLVQAIEPTRSLSHPPIFQVMLVMQNAGTAPATQLPDLTLEPLVADTGAAKFDLTITVSDRGEGDLISQFNYSTDLFDAETVDQWHRHFHAFLTHAVAAPTQRLSAISLLTEAEQRACLHPIARRFPSSDLLHDRFARQAASTPDAIAVVCDGDQLDYATLDRAANRVAHHLRRNGVEIENLVGLMLERSLDMVVAILGVLKAGGAYLPLDANHPTDRLAYMIDDAVDATGLSVVLTQDSLADRLTSESPLTILRIDGDRDAIAAERSDAPPTDGALHPDQLAYVIYTSGSTGKPKGTAISHRNVIRLFDATDPSYHFGADDVWSMTHSYAFDVSVYEIWGALLYGGKLVVVPYFVTRSPADMLALLAEQQVTRLSQTPTAFRSLMTAYQDAVENDAIPDLDSLRSVIFAGEALDVTTVGPWIERFGPTGLVPVNMYGITETTVHVAYREITSDDLGHPKVSPIGEPMPDLAMHLLDPNGRPVPVGMAGEIYVAGEGLARGYVARPSLTAQRFVPDPYSDVPGTRLYRSGDLARRRSDGETEFIGRADHQVKIRGFRIELGEIEATLASHPSVTDAVVLAHQTDGDERRLVAWIVGVDGVPATAETLREFLLGHLPDYMVPSAFVPLDALPLTANGKLDRKALPAPDAAAAARTTYVAPTGDTETTIAAIWCDLLDLEQVGAQDDFFALGGHSLIATVLSARLRDAFEVDLPLRDLFEAPVLRAMAERVDAMRHAGVGLQAPPLVPAPESAPKQLSFAQERMWFLDRLEPGNPWYNVPAAVRLRGALHLEHFADALSEVVARHEALRTLFGEHDGQPVATVAAAAPMPLPVIDLSNETDDTREDAIQRQVAREVAQPFDLAHDQPVRAALLHCADDDHVLVITLHHIVADEWSMGVLVREVATGYSDRVEGRAITRAPLPIQYADFAHWQRGWLRDEVLEQQLGFWREQLAGSPTLLELPTDRPRPRTTSYRGAVEVTVLPAEVAQPMRDLGKAHGATTFMTVLTAFAVVLGRYAGQDDVVIGTPSANRERVELEPLIGYFVNTLALRVRFDDDPTFPELLARTRKVMLNAHAVQDVPFEQLVQALQPERSLSHTPIFQVMLAMHNADQREMPALSGLTMEGLPASPGSSKFDLTLNISDTPDGGLITRLVYATDLFDATTARRMLNHLHNFLGEIATLPDRPVTAIPTLGASERNQILTEWSRLAEPFERVSVLHTLVEQQVARTPDAIAVLHETGTLSFAELEREANRMAHYLREQGVGLESMVGIALERSPELVIAAVAILKAGGAYLPLDPEYPDDRLAFMLNDAAAPLVLTTEALRDRLPDRGARVVCVDTEADTIAAYPDTPTGVTVDGANPAYVIYTSGSTGKPKGVVVSHHAVANRMEWGRVLDFDSPPRFLQKTSICFDVSVAEIFAPLTAGGCCVLPKPGGTKDTGYLVDLIASAQVTHTSFPPSLLNALLDEPTFIERTQSLRSVVVGGEAVPADMPARFYSKLPSAVLDNRYGPTEATIAVTSWPCPQDPEGGPDPSLPIGLPIGEAEVYVIDQRGEPTPVGVPGEIVSGGGCLARGYLGRPALNATAFVPNPFSDEPGARLYRTGDLGRWRDDGALLFIGRLDQQVKIRGFRIELGEIDAALLRHPSVREAAVIDVADGDTRRLAAYLAPEPGSTLDLDTLRAAIGESLPDHMVPEAWTVLELLPKSTTGKIDRRALPAPVFTSAEVEDIAPRTPTEEALAAIWADVLERERVGVTDSFFDLGGHSLTATRVVSRVRNAFEVEMPVRLLFEAPTIEAMAQRVEASLASGHSSLAPPLERAPADADNRLSFAQERLWFLDRLEPGNAWYNIPTAVRLRGTLDVDAFSGAINDVVARHEALRTHFTESDGLPRAVVSDTQSIDLVIVDLDLDDSTEGGDRIDRAIRERVAIEAQRPFDLARGPLTRALMLRCAADDHVLVLTMHHIVSDEWSIGVLVREIAAAYSARRTGEAAHLPELAIQYRDFAHWQRGWLRDEALTAQLDFWRDQLAGTPPLLELPTDHVRPETPTYRGAIDLKVLDAEVAESLRALGRAHGATTFMTMLAAFGAVLGRFAGQDDVVVGTPITNRSRIELEPLIGFFVNTLPLRLQFDDDPSFEDFLERARDTMLAANERQDLPFEQMVHALDPTRNLNHAPIFQVMLVVQAAGNAPSLAIDDLTMESLPADAGGAKFDLTLNVSERGDHLVTQLNYSTDLFDAETISRWHQQLHTFIRHAVTTPTRSLSAIPLLTEAEQRACLVPVARRFPSGDLLHDRFARQATATPDAVAVVLGDAESDEPLQLDYRALDQRANQLAHRLRRAGVGPDTLVGLLLDRDVDLVIAVLGILKAGGAYLPLDPAHPADRLAFVLDDASTATGLPIVVTQDSLVDRLPSDGTFAILSMDSERASLDAEPADQPPVGVDVGPDQLAYVIYTSGSTGKPKGTAISHRNVVRLFDATESWFHFGADDVWTLFHSSAFDFSVWELWGPLLHGGTLVVVPYWVSRNPAAVVELLASHRVTVLNQTPTAFRALVAAHRDATPAPSLSNLRTVIFGGEALDVGIVGPWLETLGPGGFVPVNMYGITETTVHVTYRPVTTDDLERPSISPIGVPIPDLAVHLLDGHGQPVPVGIAGEIYVAGDGLARGYLARPALTAERFVPDPYSEDPGARLYRSGDLARRRPDGEVAFVGRADHQVKIRGFRIELGEIETTLASHPSIADAVVLAHDVVAPSGTDRRLAAWVVAADGAVPSPQTLREHLLEGLPDYMVPARFETLDALPLTNNGKLDRKALIARIEAKPAAGLTTSSTTDVGRTPPASAIERTIADAWREVLGVEDVATEDSFFDLGGHSLLLAQVHARLRKSLDPDLSMVDLFRFPTIQALASHLGDDTASVMARAAGGIDLQARIAARRAGRAEADIAIIAVNGRFPNAPDIDSLWHNLTTGVDAVTHHSADALRAAGVPDAMINHPDYVPASVVLDDIDQFDASFFGYAPSEAQIIDPQQRVFLEVAWEAFERAGYDTARYRDRVAVYAGVGFNTYQLNLFANPELLRKVGVQQSLLSNDKDFLPTRVSYQLDLRGPSVNVQSACSTSLVAVALACDSLVDHRADMALAGGVNIRADAMTPTGYLYEQGGLASRDGRTRSFDADGTGAIAGNGAGVVILKRLEDARRDGDHVHAVIKGWAINNDGGNKLGWTTPGVDGQIEVIREAMAAADVDPSSIRFVETQGTATALGDSVEVEALNQAFGIDNAPASCAIGSIKSSLGHLNAAAGIAGLIKTVLALDREAIPPSLHFETPNPKAPFDQGPFFVNNTLRPWPTNGQPRRAGVSAMGIGGTNAHLVLEEAPSETETSADSKAPSAEQLILLSAKTRKALETATANLARHLEAHPELDMADVAFTLRMGRRVMAHRRALVAADRNNAIRLLDAPNEPLVLTAQQTNTNRAAVFLLPGDDVFEIGMGQGLYTTESVYREAFDRCAALFQTHIKRDPRSILFDTPSDASSATPPQDISPLDIAVSVFASQYALARLLMANGIKPRALIGHGVGEYVAANLAGMLSLDDAARLTASGATSKADTTEDPFAVEVTAPTIPCFSSAAGTWHDAEAAADLNHWRARGQSPGPVTDAVAAARTREQDAVVVKLGLESPNATEAAPDVMAVLRRPDSAQTDRAGFQRTLGRLWLDGVALDGVALDGVAPDEHARPNNRRRVALPTYPFQRQRFWIEGPSQGLTGGRPASGPRPATAALPLVARNDDELDVYVAPRNDTESRLAALWQDLLGVEQVGIHDNFFELGGSSLMAVRLGGQVRDQFVTELSPHFLLEAPTVASLGTLLESTSTASSDGGEDRAESKFDHAGILVPMTPADAAQGNATPLVLIHPMGGHVYFYRQLAFELGAVTPIVGIRARGLEGDESPYSDLREMAAHYVDELRTIQPTGPYRLGGSSMGGMVAYEMAQKLVAEGEEVELLALLDTTIVPKKAQSPVGGEDAAIEELIKGRGDAALGDLAGLDKKAQLEAIIDQAKEAGALPEGVAAQQLIALTQAHTVAVDRFDPQPYPGRVTFFRAGERRSFDLARPEEPWVDLAQGGIEIHVVPGDHLSMHFPPHLPTLASRFRSILDILEGYRNR